MIVAYGTVIPSMMLVGHRQRQCDAEREPDDDTDDGAEHRHDHRFPSHRASQLPAGHPDGSQQPDLARAFEDRQRERDGDADDGDHDRHAEQAGDDGQQLVDLTLLLLAELGVALQVGLREVVECGLRSRRRAMSGSTPSASLASTNWSRGGRSLTASSVRDRDVPVGAERAVVEDPRHGERPFDTVLERDVDGVADLDVEIVGRVLVHHQRRRPSSAVEAARLTRRGRRAGERRPGRPPRTACRRRRRCRRSDRNGDTACSTSSCAMFSSTCGGSPRNDSSVTM